MRAKFVICANGTLSKPKLSKIAGMESFAGHSFHSSRWDYAYTGRDLENLADKVVGIIGTGASAVQAIPRLGKTAKQLYVFQRTPSGIDIRGDRPTDPDWAARLEPGWQQARRMKHIRGRPEDLERAGRARRGQPRGEDPPPGERQHRPHDAHPPAHRRDRHRPGDGRRAEALVHVHVQAAVLRRRLPADLQPAERQSGRHQGQGDHRDRPGRPGLRGRDATRSTS